MLPKKHTYINSQNKQEYEYFELDFYQVIQLLMKESIKVRQEVIEYIKRLEKENMELRQALWNKQNTEWLETRKQGKLLRRDETDVIASLILYATEQGSKNANKLYVVYSKLVNNLVGIESGMRDIVSVETLEHIRLLEDLILFNLYKNTYVSKEDIKQDLMIFILKLEKKIKDKKIDNIDNVKGYIVHCLKMKTSNVCKKFFSDMIKNNFIDIMEYESYLVNCDNINVERDLVNKQYLNDLFEYYQVK